MHVSWRSFTPTCFSMTFLSADSLSTCCSNTLTLSSNCSIFLSLRSNWHSLVYMTQFLKGAFIKVRCHALVVKSSLLSLPYLRRRMEFFQHRNTINRSTFCAPACFIAPSSKWYAPTA